MVQQISEVEEYRSRGASSHKSAENSFINTSIDMNLMKATLFQHITCSFGTSAQLKPK